MHLLSRFPVWLGYITLFSVCGHLGSRPGSSAEVPLWPLLRIEQPQHQSGAKVDFLWPIFELDTTQTEPAFAVRPLVSYDQARRRGTFLFPIGWFGKDFLNMAPILWTKWGAESRFILAPVFGKWNGREKGFSLGPGFYLQSSGPRGEKKGSLVPPIFQIRSNDGKDQRNWIFNYYQRRGETRKDTALFPFFWWRSGTGKTNEWTSREIYPFFGLRRESDPEGQKKRRMWILWPLVDHTDHREGFERNLLGYAIQWGKKGGENWRAVLPFFYHKNSQEKKTFALPFLGFFKHNNNVTGENRWLAWPFLGHRETPKKDTWSFLSGLIRTRKSKTTDERMFAPLWPIAKWESSTNATSHRFWPLYRYSSQSKPHTEKRLYALAELIGVEDSERIQGGFWFLLRPITFQQSETSGESHFRFMWKFIESHKTDTGRNWAINPLYYSRTDELSKRRFLLGGLLGLTKQQNQTTLRALWFLNFRLPK